MKPERSDKNPKAKETAAKKRAKRSATGRGAADQLTEKQKAFCAEYLIDLNASQAAIREGYSESTAYSIGHENLKKPAQKKTARMIVCEEKPNNLEGSQPDRLVLQQGNHGENRDV